jgi:hypothetical protein
MQPLWLPQLAKQASELRSWLSVAGRMTMCSARWLWRMRCVLVRVSRRLRAGTGLAAVGASPLELGQGPRARRSRLSRSFSPAVLAGWICLAAFPSEFGDSPKPPSPLRR